MSDYGKYVQIFTGTLTIGGLDFGNVKLVRFNEVREKYPIVGGQHNLSVDVKEFIKELRARFVLDKFDYELWEKILGITAQNISAGTQAVTDEEVTFTGASDTYENGSWHQLAHGRGAESPLSSDVVTGSGGAPPYDNKTDYIFDYELGRIARLTAGGIGATETIEIDYEYTTQASKKIRFSDVAINTKAEVIFTHPLQDGSKTFTIHLPEAYIDSDVEISLAPDELTAFEIECVSLYDETQADEELGWYGWTTS